MWDRLCPTLGVVSSLVSSVGVSLTCVGPVHVFGELPLNPVGVSVRYRKHKRGLAQDLRDLSWFHTDHNRESVWSRRRLAQANNATEASRAERTPKSEYHYHLQTSDEPSELRQMMLCPSVTLTQFCWWLFPTDLDQE